MRGTKDTPRVGAILGRRSEASEWVPMDSMRMTRRAAIADPARPEAAHPLAPRGRLSGACGLLLIPAFVTLSSVCAAESSGASAGDEVSAASARDEAARHFEEGMTHVEAGNVKDALEEFQRAYALVPHYAVLYNIGQAYGELGQPLLAVDALRRYLNEGGTQIEQGRRADVERLVQRLEATIGRIRVVSPAPGASIELDGVSVGPVPVAEPLRVNPGTHRISARWPGEPAVTKTLVVGPGQTVEVTVAPSASKPTLRAPVHPPRYEEPAPPGSERRFRRWNDARLPLAVGVGVTGLGVIGIATTYGIRSLNKEARSDELCAVDDGDPVSCARTRQGLDGYSLNQQAMEDAKRAWIGLAIGGTLVAGAATLWLTTPRDRKAEKRQAATAGLAVSKEFRGVFVQGPLR